MKPGPIDPLEVSLAAFKAERGGELRVFARDADTRIRFISDGLPVTVGRLCEIAFFDTPDEAARIAAACADILERIEGSQADADGWHELPAGAKLPKLLPNLLAAARNKDWTDGQVPYGLDKFAIADDPPTPVAATAMRRKQWTIRRAAWLGFLVGLGWTAKRIADDELIHTTPGNVYRQAMRMGLSLSATSSGHVSIDLPASTLAVIDRAASTAHMQRDAFIKRLLIRAANDPARYGLVVVSTRPEHVRLT